MADFALDHACDDWEHYDRYKNASPAEQYEEGLIDEHGFPIGNPGSLPVIDSSLRRRQRAYRKMTNPIGEGPCPFCGAATELKSGKYGEFYGCIRFPSCNGSRNKEGE